ncbi:MAG: hypothetical protein GX493_12515, partial [Firmicutes bacterium]|nr:hypothetical protein [Bacillota bacterium]
DRIVVKIRGLIRKGADAGEKEALATNVVLEEVGEVVYVRLRSPYPDFLLWPRVDQAEVMIPPKYRLNARGCFNLNAEEFHGTVE